MSVTVPTASGTEPQQPDPPIQGRRRRRSSRRWRGWWVLLAVVTLALAFWDRDPATQDLVDEVEPPSASFSVAQELVLEAVPALQIETFFPGEGTFTAHAGSRHGQVAVGQRSDTAGAFVHTTDPAGEVWTPGSIEVAERAWVGDVSPWMDTFVIGGAIAGPGMGSSVPTLWSGTVDGEFRVLEHPFAGPGRVDRLRVLHGDLFLMGQGAAPFTDTLASGSARFGRLLVGRPGAWSDITPEGSNVIVNDIVGYGDGLVAVGGDIDGALAWWLAAGSDEWVTIDIGDGVATGAAMTTEEGLVVSVLTVSPDGEPSTSLLAGTAPRSLSVIGSPLRVSIGEIEAYSGGVIGSSVAGDDSAGLWWYRFGEGWTTIAVGDPGAIVRVVHDSTATPDLVALGSAAGQPAVWSGGVTEPRILKRFTPPEWEFVSLLPGGANQVLDIGTHLFAYRNALDAGTVWVSANRSPWHGVETVDGFGLTGATGSDDGWVMFGETDTMGVVYEVHRNGELTVHLLPGDSIRHAARSGRVLTVLASSDAGPVRIELVDGSERSRTPLDHLPARILQAGSVLVGGEFGAGVVTVSRDDGQSWAPLAGTHVAVGWTGERTLLVSEDGQVNVLYPETLDLLPLADVDPTRSMVWADGVLVASGSEFRLVARASGDVADIDPGVDGGIDGVFERPVPGPGGYALVTERGFPALYGWVGPPP